MPSVFSSLRNDVRFSLSWGFQRNLALYDEVAFVSHPAAEEALKAAREYLNVIQTDVDARKS